MNLFVDTSVWSLAWRRDRPQHDATVDRLTEALQGAEAVFTTGLVLQELLQGFRGPRARQRIVERFASLPYLVPDRRDYVEAAELRNTCRRRGIQAGTIDALLAQLCIRHGLTLLTADADFTHIGRVGPLRLWAPRGRPRG